MKELNPNGYAQDHRPGAVPKAFKKRTVVKSYVRGEKKSPKVSFTLKLLAVSLAMNIVAGYTVFANRNYFVEAAKYQIHEATKPNGQAEIIKVEAVEATATPTPTVKPDPIVDCKAKGGDPIVLDNGLQCAPKAVE